MKSKGESMNKLPQNGRHVNKIRPVSRVAPRPIKRRRTAEERFAALVKAWFKELRKTKGEKTEIRPFRPG